MLPLLPFSQSETFRKWARGGDGGHGGDGGDLDLNFFLMSESVDAGEIALRKQANDGVADGCVRCV